MCVYHSDRTTMSYDLMSYVWAQIAGTSSFVADMRRNIYFYWHSQLEAEMVHCDTPDALPHLVTRSETVQEALPDAQTLRRLGYALWATRYKSEPPVPASVIEDETRYLHFDFTYLVVSGIFVKHNNKRLQLSYTLGTVQGSSGLVLATRILPTEKWDYMRLVFDDTFQQCTQPPVMIWIDDWEKWHRLLLGLCASVFGAGHGTRIGQDWRHFKEILLAHVDRQDPGFSQFRRTLEGLLKRIRLPDDAEAAIATPAGLRAVLRDIFNEYQEPKDPVGGRLVRGAAFARGATFSICSAVGNYFLDGTPMDVDLNDLVGQAARKGLLAGEQVSGVWTTYLEKSDEFYEAILLIREVPQEVSPGTNIVESLHSRLQANPVLRGKKNYTTAEMEIDLTVRRWNASLLQARFAPAQDVPIADGQPGALPLRKRRRRLNRFDVPIETTGDLFRKLATNGLDALRSDWKRAFWSLISFQQPGNSYSSLKARRFAVRFSHKSPLTADEKERIKAALSDLADQGPAIMGRYRYVANWIATVCLGSQRSPGQVASHMRLLIKEAHAAAVLRGKTTHPLPQALVFTQPATEADDAVDPERLEVEAESDDDSDDDVFDDFSD